MKKLLFILSLLPHLVFSQGFVANSGGTKGFVSRGIVNGTLGFVANNTPPAGIDADVQAWITATGISNIGVINAYNTFVIAWKAAGYWTNTKFMHPYTTDAGTGAPALAQMKYNLKDPRDLDAAFRLTASGGGTPTYSNAGYVNGGAGCWLQTFAKPNPTFTNQNAVTLIIGVTTNVFEFAYEIGAADFSGGNINLFFRVSNNNSEGSVNTVTIPTMTASAPTSKGLWFVTRTGVNNEAMYKNNSSTPWQTSTTVSTIRGPNQQIVVGALGTGGSATNPSTKTYVIDIGYDDSIVGSDAVIMGNLINQLEKDIETAQGLSTGTRSWF